MGGLVKNIGNVAKKVADPGDIFGWNPNSPFGIKPNLPAVAADPTASLAASNKEGQQLLKNYQTGTLTGGEKALVGQYKQGATAALNQEMASAGLSKSSAAAEGTGVIDEQAAAMTQQFLTQDLQSSMDLMGMNLNAYYQTEALDIQQNEGTAGALGSVAGAIGSIFA